MTEAQHITVADGTRLCLRRWGAGRPKHFLVHGFADGSYVWQPVVSLLRDLGPTLAVDLRGHGNSDKDPQRRYDIDTYVADLVCVLETLELTDLVLVGHSLGAEIAARLACELPDRIAALVLVDGGPQMRHEIVRVLQQKFESQAWHYRSAADYAAYLAENLPFADRATLETIASLALRRDGADRLQLCADPALRIEQTVTKSGIDTWGTLRGSDCPILLARGAASGLLTRAGALRTAQELRNCRFVTIERAGHAVMLDNPQDLACEIRRFIRDLASCAQIARACRLTIP